MYSGKEALPDTMICKCLLVLLFFPLWSFEVWRKLGFDKVHFIAFPLDGYHKAFLVFLCTLFTVSSLLILMLAEK